MRLLMLEDDARYCALIRHHIACKWPDAELLVSSPAHGSLPADFLAQGFDAVLLANEWSGGRGLDCLKDLASRRGFAPLIFLTERSESSEARRALQCGAHAVVGKSKVEHEKLIAAISSAANIQADARLLWRTSPEALEAQRFSGAFIRGYRRIRRLAGGLVSDLYLAESEQAGALVVIKVARDREKENELDDSFRRFLQEYEIVQRIRSPSVVRLYDLGVSDEHAYLVMEYFPAGDLRRRMRAGLLPREAVNFAIGITRALEAVHAAGVLHRDLKPGNVMLREDGSLALIDFGLSKHDALELEATDRGMIFGTPHYMSPEQGHGEPIDGRSDLYSVGIMLFEMLTGEKPYVAENPMAIIYMHRKAPIPRLPEGLATLQPVLDRLVAKDPADRYPTATEACADLEAAAKRLDASQDPSGNADVASSAKVSAESALLDGGSDDEDQKGVSTA